jgi:methyl-accepting chemotaxis protein
MQSGNGIDLAAIHQLLTEVAQTVRSHSERFEQIDHRFEQIDRRFDQVADVLNEHSRKIDDVAAGLRELRSTLYQYHEAVVGHGISLTRLDERVRRIEEHLALDPAVG